MRSVSESSNCLFHPVVDLREIVDVCAGSDILISLCRLSAWLHCDIISLMILFFCFVYFSSVLFGKLTQTVEKWQIKEERAMEQGKLTISERFVIIIRAAVSALDLSERDSSSSKDYKALSSSHTQKICAR